MIISVLKKIVLLPFFLRYLSPAVKKKHISLTFSKKQGDHVVLPYKKNKSIKLQTFA